MMFLPSIFLGVLLACHCTHYCTVRGDSIPVPLPDGFSREPLFRVDITTMITGLQFINNKLLLVAQSNGVIQMFNLATHPEEYYTYLDLSDIVYAGGERGLMSIKLDPDFTSNGYIYCYYSIIEGFRISRFRHSLVTSNDGSIRYLADRDSELIVWADKDGMAGLFHYGGQLDFGPDGYIYLSMGDKYIPDDAQDLSKTAGCIIRVKPDGSFPKDNMGIILDGKHNTIPDGCWAYGLRNGYRARWDLETSRYLIAEVGGNNQETAWEDLHLGRAGANYGWPNCEGRCDNPQFKRTCNCKDYDDPIFTYNHFKPGEDKPVNAAIIGGLVYRGNMFPSKYNGVYFYADYSLDSMHYLVFDESGEKVKESVVFEGYFPGVIHLEQAPDGSLYAATVFGSVHHIFYSSGNQPPINIKAKVYPLSGATPLQLSMAGAAEDLEDDELTYVWLLTKKDGDSRGTKKLSGEFVSVELLAAGSYDVTLRVSDKDSTVQTETYSVMVGSAPTVAIHKLKSYEFNAGDEITLTGEGKLPYSGEALQKNELQWLVRVKHDDHYHPFAKGTGTEISFKINKDGHNFIEDVSIEVDLIGTDSTGLTATDTVILHPNRVKLKLGTSPSGFNFFVDGIPIETPVTVKSLVDFEHAIHVDEITCKKRKAYRFGYWTDTLDGDINRRLKVPSKTIAIVAKFFVVGECTDDHVVLYPDLEQDLLKKVSKKRSKAIDKLESQLSELNEIIEHEKNEEKEFDEVPNDGCDYPIHPCYDSRCEKDQIAEARYNSKECTKMCTCVDISNEDEGEKKKVVEDNGDQTVVIGDTGSGSRGETVGIVLGVLAGIVVITIVVLVATRYNSKKENSRAQKKSAADLETSLLSIHRNSKHRRSQQFPIAGNSMSRLFSEA